MIRLKLPALTLLFLYFGVQSTSFAQVEAQRYWFLGNGTNGVRFDQPDNEASLITKPAVSYGTGGGAVVTDPTSGTLLFYTDGANVYDINHTLMPNGGGLSGNPGGNNPAVVVPVPGQPDQYYIITNNADYNTIPGTVQFSIVDMSQFGNAAFPSPATGDVTTKNQPIPGLTGQAEGMIVIPHSNGTDYWLITQTSGTTDYTVTLIGAGGSFTTTTYSNVGVSISAATFAYNAATGQLAVAPQNTNTDIPILTFDDTTGALALQGTNPYVLSSGVLGGTDQAIYDMAWSPNGQYLYISVYGQGGTQADVLQYDTTNPSITLASVLPGAIFESYGLQMGPDSAIYHLYRETAGGPVLMGRIEDADSVASLTTYVEEVFPGTDFNATQFPSFTPAPEVDLSVSFTSQGTCANSPTSFFPTVTPDADSLVWDFGDGSTSNQWAPTYTYTAGGTYPVTVTAYLNGQSETATVNVTITQFDLEINLVQDTTACSCELPFPKATNPPPPCTPFSLTAQINGGSPTAIEWFGPPGLLAGQTTATLAPDSAGFYYIKVYDASGCFGYAGVNINEYGIQDQRANIWFFGNNAGIDFNGLPEDPAVAISNSVMMAPEGTATISDRNGQVIIFTDGNTVWYRDETVLATGIGGDVNATQSSLIVPVPGDETLYYIFTTEAVDGGGFAFRYSLYDLKVGTTGAVVEQGVLLYTKSTERVASNGNWVVTHEWGNNNFRAYQVSTTGIGTPVVSSAGSEHAFSPADNAEGYMKFGGNNLLAVAIPDGGGNNKVELFDFIDSTGVVTNPRVLDLSGDQPAAGEVYGIEFSPGGNKLFATVSDGANSTIYEYAIDSLGNTTFLQAQSVAGDLGAMQMGPDGQIYVAVNGSSSLLTFSANEDVEQLTDLSNLQPFALAGGTSSTRGMPNFIQTISTPVTGPAMSVTGLCFNSPTQFTATGTDPIDMFQWFFGDGTGSTEQETEHTYAAPGTYNVQLRITNRCGLDTLMEQSVTINPLPDDPTFLQPGEQPVLCDSDLTLEATPDTNPDLADLDFLWSTGDTTRTILVTQQGDYAVTITDAMGCTSDGSLIIADRRPVVDLGPDLTLCQNTPLAPLDAQYNSPGFSHQWEINGVASGTTSTQSVNTSTPGVFEYKVQVNDDIFACFARDSITFTINESPAFTATGFPTTNCGDDDGRVELTITSPATSLFTYSIVGPSPTVSAIDQPAGGPYSTANDRMPGTYGVTVIDQVSGCFTTNTAVVNDDEITVSGTVNGTCDPININVTTNFTTPPTLTYRVINTSTSLEVENGTSGTGNFATDAAGLPSNNQTYVVEVTDGTCTASSTPILIDQDPTVPVTLVADGCVEPITVSVATGGTSWTWSGPNITSATDLQNITASPPMGTHTYAVTVQEAGFCDLDTVITVNVDNDVFPSLAQTDPCADQVIITATPAGSYLYRWFRDNVFDAGLGGTQAVATTANNGQTYRVELYNPASGCTHVSSDLNVDAIGALTLSLASTFGCEGSPFTITGTTNVAVSSYEWAYDGSVINGQTTNVLTATESGEYRATVSEAGCTAEETIEILLAPVTPGQLASRAIICNDPANTDPNTNQAVLDPGPGFISYNWLLNGSPLGDTNPTYTATEAGLYSVELLNTFNCPTTDEIQIDIECLPKITGPNAFRPGGLNSNFSLFTFFIDDQDFQVFIFNRWGEMVYQSAEREFQWNGNYNNSSGRPLPPGTYSYVVKYKSSYRPEDGVKEKRGGVVLLR